MKASMFIVRDKNAIKMETERLKITYLIVFAILSLSYIHVEKICVYVCVCITLVHEVFLGLMGVREKM